MTEHPVRLDDLILHVKKQHPEGTALDRLSDAVLTSAHLDELADHLIGHFVDQARRAGASWTEIGQGMGVSKQAAQKRFVPRGSDGSEQVSALVWDRLTDRARCVVAAAQEEALRARHDHVRGEHLLLGLLHEPEGLAARAIQEQSVGLESVRATVLAALGPGGDHVSARPSVPFAPQAHKVLELTVREALRMGHRYLGTEHLLLGLLGDEDGLAAKVLIGLGVSKDASEERIRAALDEIRRSQRHDGWPATPEPHLSRLAPAGS